MAKDFEIIGDITSVETIAVGRSKPEHQKTQKVLRYEKEDDDM
jgi:hypothetical protein